MIAQLRQATTHIADLASGGRGSVTIGTHLFGSNILLPRAVSTFKAEHPASTVLIHHATPDELHADLLAGRVDMIVGRLYPHPEPERVTDRPLYDEPIHLVTSRRHRLQSAPRLTMAELINELWVIPVTGTSLRREMEELLLREGLRLPPNRVECTSFFTLRQLLLEADAIGVLPVLVAAEEPLLAPLRLPLQSLRRVVGVTTAAGRTLNPGGQTMLSHLEVAVGYVAGVLTVLGETPGRADDQQIPGQAAGRSG